MAVNVTDLKRGDILEMDGDHCCHNMGPIVRPRMADWMAQRLAEVPAR